MKDQFTLFNKISENIKLVEFCNRVIGYNNILMFEESRKIFLESLSVDHIININDIKDIVDIIKFIQNTIDLMILEDDIKEHIKDILISMILEIEEKYPEELKELL